eukprot:scaffold12203_cov99-Isochrysis_galbana.AAC.2
MNKKTYSVSSDVHHTGAALAAGPYPGPELRPQHLALQWPRLSSGSARSSRRTPTRWRWSPASLR